MKKIWICVSGLVLLGAVIIVFCVTSGYDGFVPDNIGEVRKELKLAYEEGIIDSPSFERLMKGRKGFNEGRKKKIENGEAVYGPVSYDEVSYFYYQYSNIHIMLVDSYVKKLNTPDEELLNLYEDECKNYNIDRPFEEVKDVIARKVAEKKIKIEINK